MARKLNKNLVALGSAAIVSIYAVGYARTQPSNQAAAAAPPSAIVVSAVPAASASPSAAATQMPTAAAIARAVASAPAAPSASAAPAATSAAYRDGTYNGSGSNRRGSLSVAVTIQGGKVTAAQITAYEMYYPAARIARLPGEVVSRQSAQVDIVSGSSYSARAFRDAVTQALSQAQA